MEGETPFVVYVGKGMGTGFIGLTDRRVIMQDNSFVVGKSALTSLPYKGIQSDSYLSHKSMFGKFVAASTVAIRVGGSDYAVEFRAKRRLVTHDLILHHVIFS